MLNNKISEAAKSVYYFSFYLLASGFALFLFPNYVITLVGLAATTDIWIHLVGTLTFILGVFFFYMAKQESRPFIYIYQCSAGEFLSWAYLHSSSSTTRLSPCYFSPPLTYQGFSGHWLHIVAIKDRN